LMKLLISVKYLVDNGTHQESFKNKINSIFSREDNLSKYLWSTMSDFIFTDVFSTAAQAGSVG
jgi:hypothetical protein